MALQHHHKKKNHFPDWLFYLISAALIVFLSLFISYYSKTETLTETITKTSVSLDSVKTKVSELNSFYENQGKLVIQNDGSNEFTVTDFYITYYDTDKKTIKTIKGMINSTIEPGSSCKPFYRVGEKLIWNGEVLFYYISVKGGDILGNARNRYYAGNWEKGKQVLGISLDGEDDSSDRIYPKCGN